MATAPLARSRPVFDACVVDGRRTRLRVRGERSFTHSHLERSLERILQDAVISVHAAIDRWTRARLTAPVMAKQNRKKCTHRQI